MSTLYLHRPLSLLFTTYYHFIYVAHGSRMKLTSLTMPWPRRVDKFVNSSAGPRIIMSPIAEDRSSDMITD